MRHQIYKPIISSLITNIYAGRQHLIHHSDHISTLALWQMDRIQRERRTVILLRCKKIIKPKWQCRTIGCVKQAQSGRKSFCKRCYNELVLNQPTINLTQGAENLASLGDRGSNNATVSLQRDATSIYRAENLASFNDRVNNDGTCAGINKNISYDNAICDNNPRDLYNATLHRLTDLVLRIIHQYLISVGHQLNDINVTKLQTTIQFYMMQSTQSNYVQRYM
jgi:hypothetical protein